MLQLTEATEDERGKWQSGRHTYSKDRRRAHNREMEATRTMNLLSSKVLDLLCSPHTTTPSTHDRTINTPPLKPLLKQKPRGQTLKPNKNASDFQPLWQGTYDRWDKKMKHKPRRSKRTRLTQNMTICTRNLKGKQLKICRSNRFKPQNF